MARQRGQRRAGWSAGGLWRDPLLRYLVLAGMLFAIWYLSGWGSVTIRITLFWIVQVCFDLFFTYFSYAITRLPNAADQVRSFWRWLALGGLFFTAGDSAQVAVALTRGTPDTVNGADLSVLLVVAGVASVVWAMLRYPIRAQGRQRLRWWLDAATTMVGATAFVWYFLWAGPSATSAVHLAVLVLGTALMLVSAFGAMKLMLGGDAPFTRLSATLGGISALLIALGTAFGETLSAALPLNVVMVLRLLPTISLAATPRVQQLQMAIDPGALLRRARPPYSRLPYLAVVATQALLVAALLTGGLSTRAWGALITVILGTGLVMVRQLVAFADNARLLTNLDEANATLRRQEERFRSLVQHASDVTLVTDAGGVITYVSPAIRRVLGIEPEQVVGANVRDLADPADLPGLEHDIDTLLATPSSTVRTRLRGEHADGSQRWLEVLSTNLLDDPSVGGVICNVRDVTEARRFQERLRYEATHDSLTGLANRTLFDERTEAGQAEPTRADEVGILVIDLDDFKIVNDTLGHHIGDRLLAVVGQRLLSCVRPTDTVARLGGDEFAVLLPGASSADATAVAARVLESLSAPVLVDSYRLSARASIGVAVGPRGEADRLLRASDAAMYAAKQGGKGRFLEAEPPGSEPRGNYRA